VKRYILRRVVLAIPTLFLWGEVRASDVLERDDAGRHVIRAKGTKLVS
jgi:hypothetical protein